MSQKNDSQSIYSAVSLIFVFFTVVMIATVTLARPPQQQAQTTANEIVNIADLKRYEQENISFSSQVLLNRSKAEVSFPFAFDGEIPILWLSYVASADENPIDVLVSHPQIWDLNWQRIKEGEFSLYQKTPTYTSINEFINNLPPLETIASDAHIRNDVYPELKKARRTSEPIDMEQVDYILTSFDQSSSINDVHYFKRVIDVTLSSRDNQNQVTWTLRNSTAKDGSRFLFGGVKIDFKE